MVAAAQHRSSHHRARSVATEPRAPSERRRRRSVERSVSRARGDEAAGSVTRCQPRAATSKAMSGTAAFFQAMAPSSHRQRLDGGLRLLLRGDKPAGAEWRALQLGRLPVLQAAERGIRGRGRDIRRTGAEIGAFPDFLRFDSPSHEILRDPPCHVWHRSARARPRPRRSHAARHPLDQPRRRGKA